MTVHVCTSEDMHPYECDGPGKCRHCDRDVGGDHDPATCALCDPEYDFQPNTYWAANSQPRSDTTREETQ